MEIRNILAQNVKRLRQEREDLADRTDVDRTYIGSLERPIYAAGVDVVDRLAKALGVTAAELLKAPNTK